MNPLVAAKNMGVQYNVTFRVIDRSTGKVSQEVIGHNSATKSMMIGIGHYLLGDGVLNQGHEMLSQFVPRYISLGYNPQEAGYEFSDIDYPDPPNWNLRYDSTTDAANTPVASDGKLVVGTIDPDLSTDVVHPVPAVNPPMATLGDSLAT